jgi:hypothetical protein
MKVYSTPITFTINPSEKVGDILLIGRFGGAVCSYYRVVEVNGSEGLLEPVNPVSFRNDDGTFSHYYEAIVDVVRN